MYSEKLSASVSSDWTEAEAVSVALGVLTDQVDVFLKRYRAKMQVVLILADVEPTRV